MTLKIRKLHPAAQLPAYATEGAAGMDLRACLPEDGLCIKPMQRVLIPTGLAIELPGPDTVALLFARSGLALREGLAMANGVGVIDSDYRGEVKVPAVNLSDKDVRVAHGDRVAQLAVLPVCRPEMVELETLSGTARGEGGFGSTGRG